MVALLFLYKVQKVNETYIRLLIDKASPLPSQQQETIIKYLFNTFLQYQKDTLYINDGVIKKIKNKQSFLTIAKMALDIKFPDISFLSFNKKSKKMEWNIKIDEAYDTIVSINSYDMLVYKTNLFAETQQIFKDEQTSTITVVGNKLHLKEVSKNGINENEYKEIVKDYKLHFPLFDELLDLIVDMRFAKDRKASFVHLRVQSDWGKSFLSGLLKNIEIGFEVDYHNLINKGANDIAPIQVRNSFVLIVDEFNNFSQEMKKLSHSFTFAPKFGMSETVELFLKILLSAEKSPSFSGGVDTQIINRVMVFEIPDDKASPLIGRKTYLQFGNAKYMRALEYYSFLRLKNRIDEYLKKEEFTAHKAADDRVRECYNQYKMNTAENINDKIKNIINDKIADILLLKHSDGLSFMDKQISDKIKQLDEMGNQVFINSPLKVCEHILKNETTENEFKKMRFKLVDINSILNVTADYTKSPKTGYGRGLIIDINKQIPVSFETIDKDGNLVSKDGKKIF